MKKERAKTYRYKNGDIFRVQLNSGKFGYGIIISKIVPLKKMGIIPEYHPLSVLMSMPILVRTFDFVTENESITIEELLTKSYLRTVIIADWNIHRGRYPIVLNRKLLPEDIDFPIYFGV